EVNVLKRNSDDVGWEYGFLVDPNNKDKVECKFYGHRSQGGVHRLKEHVANVGTNAKKCKKSTQEAKDKKKVVARELELREEVNVSRVGGEDEEVTCVGSLEPHKLGSMDKWTHAIHPKATKSESLQQQKLNKELWKKRTHEVHKYIARWKKDQLRNMVVHNRWDTLKDVKSKKGKDATATILSPTFWKDVKLCLSVFEPLVKVFHLVDGDVKPSMEIKEAYGNVQSRYNEVIGIIDKKMKGRLDSPLHLTAYLLNPYYSYGNPSIFDDATITEGFISCAVNTELKKFQNREGYFNKKLARSCEKIDYNPASWWWLYGTETPALQKLATRILSLTSSSSGCERNWSTFEMIHTKKRNRLTTTRLNKLVFIQFNSKLINKKERIMSKKITDVLLSSEATEAQGFLYEDGDNCATVVYRDEEDEEMDGTGIPWSVIGDAVGADQQLELRRSARVRQLYEGEEFESEEEEFDDDEDEYMEPY
uniref:HAT C-terminal dimerisation domain-containing protein n=1 Tax=Setaria italica TaxID=4555 RepID=K3Y297_SETIT